ncbi:MAG: alpha/beta hydrolase, partial [Bacteroidota bacterium]
ELIPKLFPPEFAAANPELLAQLIEGAKHYPAEGLATAMEAMRDRPDQTELISNFPFPVGIIVGLQDTLIPGNPIDLNQMKLRGGGVIKMTRSIGHMGMYEAPEETRSHLKEFLAFGEVSKD